MITNDAVLGLILLSLSHVFSFAAMTERKYSLKFTFICFAVELVLFLVSSFIMNIYIPNALIALAISYPFTVVLGFTSIAVLSKDGFGKIVFMFSSYVCVFCIFQELSTVISQIIDFGAIHGYVRVIVRTIMYIPAIILYIKYVKPMMREIDKPKNRSWWAMSAVAFVFCLLLSIEIVAMLSNFSLIISTLVFLTILAFVIVYLVVLGNIRNMLKENSLELVKQNISYLREQLSVSEQSEQYAKLIRHDIRHHNQNIAAFAQRGDTEQILKYIEQYDKNLLAVASKVFCPNTTVNAILQSFATRAENMNIEFNVEADTNKDAFVDDIDFVAIISNILENAFHGYNERENGGAITFNIRNVGERIVIVCKNPCADVKLKNGLPEAHGTGISSVLFATHRYNGDINYTVENGILSVCIVLKPQLKTA